MARIDAKTKYLSIIESCGGRQEELGDKERWGLAQRWRTVYAAPLHAATGKWIWHEFDWHVFSYNYARSKKGQAAIAEYERLAASTFIILPGEKAQPSLTAFRISGGDLPRFEDSGWDVMVWPDDLTWTMAFTHEEGWLGPYFSMRELVDSHA
jgi:hypothetical protein